jgi:hypothetical protein
MKQLTVPEDKSEASPMDLELLAKTRAEYKSNKVTSHFTLLDSGKTAGIPYQPFPDVVGSKTREVVRLDPSDWRCFG